MVLYKSTESNKIHTAINEIKKDCLTYEIFNQQQTHVLTHSWFVQKRIFSNVMLKMNDLFTKSTKQEIMKIPDSAN